MNEQYEPNNPLRLDGRIREPSAPRLDIRSVASGRGAADTMTGSDANLRQVLRGIVLLVVLGAIVVALLAAVPSCRRPGTSSSSEPIAPGQ